jgi:aryl-alcohol dehydrogenase-like predicted oxidoreductase
MTFSGGNKDIASVYKVGADLAEKLVSAALDAGINLFDTADAYAGGESEALLGAALKTRRSEAVIATKVGFRTGEPLTQSGLSRRHILWSVDQSLKRLGTDWIDLYIVHREDPHTPLEETLQALDDLVQAGKVRYVGFSNWSAWKAAAAIELQKAHGWAPFTHGQMNYSLLGRDVERDIIPMMQHYGLGLTVWSPLAAGFLSGKYNPESLKDPANRLSGFDVLPTNKELGFTLVEQMRGIAQKHGASVAQVAFSWLLSKRAVTSVLVGSTKRSQLEDNLKAIDLQLTPEELSMLDSATALPPVYPNWFIDNAIDQPVAQALNANI